MATKPRQIVPGRMWFVTGRALARQHRFVPKPEIVDAIWYCLAVAAQRYEVKLHGFTWMSNHYHLVLTDTAAQLPDFMRDLNSLISKAINAIRKIRGQNFERSGYNAVVVADVDRVLHHCAYTEANPCNAGLVDTARDWEGVTSARLEYGEEKTVRRPSVGLWSQAESEASEDMDKTRAWYCGRIKCPAVASFRLFPPPGQSGDSSGAERAQVRKRIEALEIKARRERELKNRSVVGMKKVREVEYTDSPSNLEAFFETEPTVSASNPEIREALKRELADFVERYRQALEEFREKGKALFPAGTWWMRRCLNVSCYAFSASG